MPDGNPENALVKLQTVIISEINQIRRETSWHDNRKL